MPGDRRDLRDMDGHSLSNRTGGYDYGVNPASKPYGNAAIAAETSRSGSRGDSRLPPGAETEYRTLKISELGSQLNDDEIEDGLFHEFKKFGDVSVKMSRENDDRVALVKFRRPEDARAAKHARGKLVLYERPLKIEAVYTNRLRSRSPVPKEAFPAGQRHLHTQRALSPPGLGYRDYRLQQLALGRLPQPPLHLRELERERELVAYEARSRPPFLPECSTYCEEDLPMTPEDDQRANRTLFLGNLDISVTESDIRRAFDRFGTVTEVDIKRAVRGQSNTYGFIKFENLDMAHRAKVVMSGKVVGHNPIKIGYGKPTPSTRLWVGGLGPWVPPAALAQEFDRFGAIRTIDYRKGDVWAYIQYESLDAAQAACSHMRGFPLGGPDRRLRVDFAETEHRYQQPPLQSYVQLPLPPHYDLLHDPFGHRLADPARTRERSPPANATARFRDRDSWSTALGVPDRSRSATFDSAERPERRTREAWSVERDFQGRKRRRLDVERSPGVDYALQRRRRGSSPERSPCSGSWDGGRFSDLERPPTREHPEEQEKRRKVAPLSPVVGGDKERKRRAPGCGSSATKSLARKEGCLASPSSAGKPPAKSQKLSRVWQGDLLLKNSSFSASLHLLQGEPAVAAALLVDGSTGGQVAQLKISQRLRLDQPKLDEVSRRMKTAGAGSSSVLLAVPGSDEDDGAQGSSQRPLKNLVSYLKQKESAGIISLPAGGARDKEHCGILHVFPPCEFSKQFVDEAAKAFAKSEDDYLLVVIIRGAS